MQGRPHVVMQEQTASLLLASHPDVNCSCDLRRDCMGFSFAGHELHHAAFERISVERAKLAHGIRHLRGVQPLMKTFLTAHMIREDRRQQVHSTYMHAPCIRGEGEMAGAKDHHNVPPICDLCCNGSGPKIQPVKFRVAKLG